MVITSWLNYGYFIDSTTLKGYCWIDIDAFVDIEVEVKSSSFSRTIYLLICRLDIQVGHRDTDKTNLLNTVDILSKIGWARNFGLSYDMDKKKGFPLHIYSKIAKDKMSTHLPTFLSTSTELRGNVL